MKRFPQTRKAILIDAAFYGIILLVLSTVFPILQDAWFDQFGGRMYFAVWSAAGYALVLLTLKIFKDWRSGRRT